MMLFVVHDPKCRIDGPCDCYAGVHVIKYFNDLPTCVNCNEICECSLHAKHDPLCINVPLQFVEDCAMCRVIAKVREDERGKANDRSV